MSQHYQRNVISVMKFCNHCGKLTHHRVDDRRVGNCLNPHVDGMSKKQEAKLRREIKQFQLDKANSNQPDLFKEES